MVSAEMENILTSHGSHAQYWLVSLGTGPGSGTHHVPFTIPRMPGICMVKVSQHPLRHLAGSVQNLFLNSQFRYDHLKDGLTPTQSQTTVADFMARKQVLDSLVS